VHQLVAEFEQLIAADLNHPVVATPLATGITGVSAYLAQDYVAAESLDLAVREYGAAPPADALRVAVQLAGALDLAAVANVYHGALHPRDVLLSDDETRLTGVGVARALEVIGIVAPVRRPYTAPERRSSGPWNRQADVFGLAALVHELLWGRRLAAEGREVAASLSDLAGANMSALRGAFTRALAERPDDRFESALDFAEALKDAFPDVHLTEPAPRRKKAALRKKTPASSLPLEETLAEPQEPAIVVDPEAPRAEPAAALEATAALESLQRFEAEPVEHVEPFVSASPAKSFSVPEHHERLEPLEPEPSERLEPLEPLEPQPREHLEPFEPLAAQHPSALLTPPEPLDQTHSAVWPLMAALVIGLSIGFAGGYGIGTTREHPVATGSDMQPAQTQASVAPASATAGRDATEMPVAPAAVPPATAAPAKSTDSRPRDRRPSPAPERRSAARSDPAPSRPAPPQARPSAAVPTGTSGQFVGRLSVDSRPVGARVFLDNKPIGVTPLAMPSIPAGEHAIRLERDGYRHWTSTVRVVSGEQNRVTASLDR
jgi:hypothetical protein